MKSPSIEMLKEGYLVKGTKDISYARMLLGKHNRGSLTFEAGTWRKVPGQWSSFNLYKGSGRGSFEGVLVTFGSRS